MNSALTVEPRQMIRWAYAMMLGREPESEAIIDLHIAAEGGATIEAVRQRVFASAEFLEVMQAAGLSLAPAAPAAGPLDGMLAEAPTGAPGCFTDRFGVRTRVEYLPPAYAGYSGQVGSPDGSYDMPVHEPAELSALLRSVQEAKTQFAAMELGAGWGPWIVLGAHLARRRGLPATVAGVEGSTDHAAYMRTHMTDNGFDPAQHHIIHAVAGAQDGVAYFPKLPDPSNDWGAQASFGAAGPAQADLEEVPCLSLMTLLARMPMVDFLHCDVQGAEADVLRAGIGSVNSRVRRVCVGTHGRAIEATLLDVMSAQGWLLEHEQPCRLVRDGNKLVLAADGVQVWRNPRFG